MKTQCFRTLMPPAVVSPASEHLFVVDTLFPGLTAQRFPGQSFSTHSSQRLLTPTCSSSDRCPRSCLCKPVVRRGAGGAAGALAQPSAPSPSCVASVRPAPPDGTACWREEAGKLALRPLGAGRDRPGCPSGTAGPRDSGKAGPRPLRAGGPGLQRSWAIL